MQYKRIPNTTFSPSTICLGIALFGTDVDEVTSFELLDTFFEHGGTFLDTAHAYGEWVPGGIGQSERVIGKWLKDRGLRGQVILATKGAQPYDSTPHLSLCCLPEISVPNLAQYEVYQRTILNRLIDKRFS